MLPNQEPIPKCQGIDGGQKHASGTIDADKSWRTFMFVSVMRPNETRRSRCPHTAALLRGVAHVVSALCSILDPGKSIPAHEGGYGGILRCRLGLVVPAVNPPRMRVKGHVHPWREGEHFFFEDRWKHEVINVAPTLRALLIVDVLRPLPLLPHALNAGAV